LSDDSVFICDKQIEFYKNQLEMRISTLSATTVKYRLYIPYAIKKIKDTSSVSYLGWLTKIPVIHKDNFKLVIKLMNDIDNSMIISYNPSKKTVI
jgi:hypothetical protein